MIELQNISKSFTRSGFFSSQEVLVLDEVSLVIPEGKTVGLVGESGCGKSTLARILSGLESSSSGRIEIKNDQKKLADSHKSHHFAQMVFQDPHSSLNPRRTIAQILTDPLLVNKICPPQDVNSKARELLAMVGLSEDYLFRYPHELSGGQKQRIGIARALSLHPQVLILDEPVSALDVSVQAQILNLLLDLQADHRLTYLFISHDLHVVRHVSDFVAVMYLGRIVEFGEANSVFANPQHPYTQMLLNSSPKFGEVSQSTFVRGEVPSPFDRPSGCAFHPRCPKKQNRCVSEAPSMIQNTNHTSRCWFPENT
ncbi:MAG TPA: ATP-binding cassette domain-containing protein [Pseudobdellovibrionaceae bacterium]|nr:ATP-binding cassette domain-containing protein [Pseudobdellovibrionaceae bacterium]